MTTATWIPVRLQAGDELGSQPGHTPARGHDLAALYGLTARAIVEGNGVRWDATAINAWVLRTGGVKLSNGQPVFSAASIIRLPAGGPRPAVTPPATATTQPSKAKWVFGGLLATAAAAAAYAATR